VEAYVNAVIAIHGDLKSHMWAYKYTQGTHRVTSRKPRGDPRENPTEHPGGTWRASGP
jgi:hypothetical protein